MEKDVYSISKRVEVSKEEYINHLKERLSWHDPWIAEQDRKLELYKKKIEKEKARLNKRKEDILKELSELENKSFK